MKFKIGDEVSLIQNNFEKYVIAKSKIEELNEDNLRLITIKTNILGLDKKISNINLGDFDYLIIQSYPTHLPIEIEIPNYKLVSDEDLQ